MLFVRRWGEGSWEWNLKQPGEGFDLEFGSFCEIARELIKEVMLFWGEKFDL